MTVSSISRKWISFGAIFVMIAGWRIAAAIIKQPLILPTPEETIIQLRHLVVTVDFWLHLWATLRRGLTGFGLSLIAGIVIGMLAGRDSKAEAFFRPFIILVRSTPVVSLIVLALIWLKRDSVAIFVTFLIAFPIVVQNVIEGVHNFDPELQQMLMMYRVKTKRVFTHFYLPSLAPFLAAGISSGLGIIWKVLVAAEVLAYPALGIGTQLDTARVYLQTDKVFAWTVVVMVIGLLFDYGLDLLLKKPFRVWKGATE